MQLKLFFVLNMLLIFFNSLKSQAQAMFDTVSVYFDIGKYTLKREGLTSLDSLAKIINQESRGVLIYGYADFLGTENPNKILSTQRAKTVEHYLLSHGAPTTLILTTAGVGQREERIEGENGNAKTRKVDILIRGGSGRHSTINDKVVDTKISTKEPTDISKVDVNKLEINQTIVLKNILFYGNMHRFLPQSFDALEDLLLFMQKHPNLRIKIEGHICCRDDESDGTDIETGTNDLSFQRAKSVRDYLVKNGIDTSRLEYKGLAHKRPLIAQERTEEEQTLNRRAEIRILNK